MTWLLNKLRQERQKDKEVSDERVVSEPVQESPIGNPPETERASVSHPPEVRGPAGEAREETREVEKDGGGRNKPGRRRAKANA